MEGKKHKRAIIILKRRRKLPVEFSANVSNDGKKHPKISTSSSQTEREALDNPKLSASSSETESEALVMDHVEKSSILVSPSASVTEPTLEEAQNMSTEELESDVDIETVDNQIEPFEISPVVDQPPLSSNQTRAIASAATQQAENTQNVTKAAETPKPPKATKTAKIAPLSTLLNQALVKALGESTSAPAISTPKKRYEGDLNIQVRASYFGQLDNTKCYEPPVRSPVPCKICQETKNEVILMMLHYRVQHNITFSKTIKHFDLEPDIEDPNLYCRSCEKSYKSINTFKSHLRSTHYISKALLDNINGPLRHITPSTVPSLPAPESTTLSPSVMTLKLASSSLSAQESTSSLSSQVATSLSSSQVTTPIETTPLLHAKELFVSLQQVDSNVKQATKKPKTQLKAQPSKTASDDSSQIAVEYVTIPRCRCLICKHHFSSRGKYISHMIIAHSIDLRTVKKNSLPDWNNPEIHCKSCDTPFPTKSVYHNHCQIVHNVVNPADPKNHCHVCDITLEDLASYRKHCLQSHRMRNMKPLRDITCEHCAKIFAEEKQYKNHMQRYKKIQKGPEEDGFIAVNFTGPNYHCSICERYYISRTKLEEHDMLQHQPNENTEPTTQAYYYYCFACKKDFLQENMMNEHLQQKHKLVLDKVAVDKFKIISKFNAFPPPLDPKLYDFVMQYKFPQPTT